MDVKTIGIFGLSFSRGFDQTWFNVWRKDDGYSLDFFQDVETDDGDDEPIDTATKVSFEQGEALLERIFAEGRVEEWASIYSSGDEGMDTDLAWTLDVDGLDEEDILFSSGNGKLPPREMTMGVITAIQSAEPRFAACFEEFAS